MTEDEAEAGRRRVMALLAPWHDQTRATARRLSRSNADGDDLFHEAVLRAYDKLSELRDETKFRSWFFAILLSLHRQHHRRAFWRRLSPIEFASEAVAPAHDSEGAERMSRALATLNAKEREAVVLFELEGLSLQELAALQECSLSALKSRLSRARARLRRHYECSTSALSPLTPERLR
jgi:RNA polymerase sigma-70 factor (ECF subfamily)